MVQGSCTGIHQTGNLNRNCGCGHKLNQRSIWVYINHLIGFNMTVWSFKMIDCFVCLFTKDQSLITPSKFPYKISIKISFNFSQWKTIIQKGSYIASWIRMKREVSFEAQNVQWFLIYFFTICLIWKKGGVFLVKFL